MPLSTMTPYALEAFVRYNDASGDDAVLPVIRGIHDFFDRDIQVMEETEDYLVTSYSALRDRRVGERGELRHVLVRLLLPYVGGRRRSTRPASGSFTGISRFRNGRTGRGSIRPTGRRSSTASTRASC